MGIGKKKREIVFQIFLTIVFAILCLLILFPFLLMVGVSFSSEADLSQYGYRLIPVHASLSAYGYVFANPKSVLNAYGVTFLFSVLAMVASTFFMALLAYPLSKKAFIARRQISFYIYFTMLFSGGLVPVSYTHLDVYKRQGLGSINKRVFYRNDMEQKVTNTNGKRIEIPARTLEI